MVMFGTTRAMKARETLSPTNALKTVPLSSTLPKTGVDDSLGLMPYSSATLRHRNSIPGPSIRAFSGFQQVP